jgi:hypothetical protein
MILKMVSTRRIQLNDLVTALFAVVLAAGPATISFSHAFHLRSDDPNNSYMAHITNSRQHRKDVQQVMKKTSSRHVVDFGSTWNSNHNLTTGSSNGLTADDVANFSDPVLRDHVLTLLVGGTEKDVNSAMQFLLSGGEEIEDTRARGKMQVGINSKKGLSSKPGSHLNHILNTDSPVGISTSRSSSTKRAKPAKIMKSARRGFSTFSDSKATDVNQINHNNIDFLVGEGPEYQVEDLKPSEKAAYQGVYEKLLSLPPPSTWIADEQNQIYRNPLNKIHQQVLRQRMLRAMQQPVIVDTKIVKEEELPFLEKFDAMKLNAGKHTGTMGTKAKHNINGGSGSGSSSGMTGKRHFGSGKFGEFGGNANVGKSVDPTTLMEGTHNFLKFLKMMKKVKK